MSREGSAWTGVMVVGEFREKTALRSSCEIGLTIEVRSSPWAEGTMTSRGHPQPCLGSTLSPKPGKELTGHLVNFLMCNEDSEQESVQGHTAKWHYP